MSQNYCREMLLREMSKRIGAAIMLIFIYSIYLFTYFLFHTLILI